SFGDWNLRRSCDRSARLTYSMHQGPFGGEFTDLDARAATEQDVQGLRTAEFLNWRYGSNSDKEHLVFTARQGTNLAGCLIVKLQDEEATITDFFAIDQKNTLPGLIGRLVSFLFDTTVRRLNAPVMAGPGLTQYFRLAGFIPRESEP